MMCAVPTRITAIRQLSIENYNRWAQRMLSSGQILAYVTYIMSVDFNRDFSLFLETKFSNTNSWPIHPLNLSPRAQDI